MPLIQDEPHPSMPEISIEVPGVLKLLQKLNVNKACGPDKIPLCVLKDYATELAPSLTAIFDQSIS